MLFRLVFLKWRLLRLLDGSVASRVWGTRTARMSPPLLSRRSSKKEARHVTLGDFLYRELHSSSVSFVAGALPLPESQNRTHCCPSRIGKRGGPNILSKAGEELPEFFAIDERDHLQVGVWVKFDLCLCREVPCLQTMERRRLRLPTLSVVRFGTIFGRMRHCPRTSAWRKRIR